MGVRAAGPADMAGMHGATAKVAAAGANADHPRGVFPDGRFAAGAGRKIDRPGVGLDRKRGRVYGVGTVHRAAVRDGRWRNRSHLAPRQRDSPGSKPDNLRAAVRRRGGDGDETGSLLGGGHGRSGGVRRLFQLFSGLDHRAVAKLSGAPRGAGRAMASFRIGAHGAPSGNDGGRGCSFPLRREADSCEPEPSEIPAIRLPP